MTFDEVMDKTRSIHFDPHALEDGECNALYAVLEQVAPNGIVIEIGCQLGRSSSIIRQVQKQRGFFTIHIDPFTEQEDICRGWVDNMLRVNREPFTLLCMRTEQASRLLASIKEIDLVYVDGDHQYESVKIDLQLVGNLVRRGGWLLCHDYWGGLHEVRKAVDEFMDIGWHMLGVCGSLGIWLRK